VSFQGFIFFGFGPQKMIFHLTPFLKFKSVFLKKEFVLKAVPNGRKKKKGGRRRPQDVDPLPGAAARILSTC
jgi:hypothetical protein